MIDIIIPVWTTAVNDTLYTAIEALCAYTQDFRLLMPSSDKPMPYNINRGLDVAKSDYIALLDWDVEVSEGWLPRLCKILDEHADVGIVGGDLQPNGYYEQWGADYVGVIPTLAAGCMLFRNVGIRYDEAFPHGLWSDTDFCRQYAEAGWGVWIDRTTGVKHHLVNSGPQGAYDEMEARCKEVYAAKWGDTNYS